jgi:hypothetical protein
MLQALSCEPGSSVSTVSVYGLDDRAIEVRSLAEEKGFFPPASVSLAEVMNESYTSSPPAPPQVC